jgi:excisionase family DNA binding protein
MVNPSTAQPEIMTIEQVAHYLQLHPQVIYRHVRAGTLPVCRIGKTLRFKRSVLDEFLESGAWTSAGRFMDYVKRNSGMKDAPGSLPISASAGIEPAPDLLKEKAAQLQAPARPSRFSADID